jgi:hypothetical protein
MTTGELHSKDFSLGRVWPEGTEACNDRSFADFRQDKKDRDCWVTSSRATNLAGELSSPTFAT